MLIETALDSLSTSSYVVLSRVLVEGQRVRRRSASGHDTTSQKCRDKCSATAAEDDDVWMNDRKYIADRNLETRGDWIRTSDLLLPKQAL